MVVVMETVLCEMIVISHLVDNVCKQHLTFSNTNNNITNNKDDDETVDEGDVMNNETNMNEVIGRMVFEE